MDPIASSLKRIPTDILPQRLGWGTHSNPCDHYGCEGETREIVHPGGPFWAKKDEGSWSIPKGEYNEAEDALAAAKRELWEETGIVGAGEFLELGTFKQPSGKLISAWAIERDFDPVELRSNTCSVEWPPKSGRTVDVPEVDRAAWFSISEAVNKITKRELPIMQALAKKLSLRIPGQNEKLPSGKSHGSPL